MPSMLATRTKENSEKTRGKNGFPSGPSTFFTMLWMNSYQSSPTDCRRPGTSAPRAAAASRISVTVATEMPMNRAELVKEIS